MKHLGSVTLLAAVSLLGELLHYLIPLPIPGSIYGLLLMLLLLVTKIVRVEKIHAVSDWLLTLMPVMFIGPAVGLIVSYDALRAFWIPILLVTTLTTVIVMAVTGRTAQWLIQRNDKKTGSEDTDHAQ